MISTLSSVASDEAVNEEAVKERRFCVIGPSGCCCYCYCCIIFPSGCFGITESCKSDADYKRITVGPAGREDEST